MADASFCVRLMLCVFPVETMCVCIRSNMIIGHAMRIMLRPIWLKRGSGSYTEEGIIGCDAKGVGGLKETILPR